LAQKVETLFWCIADYHMYQQIPKRLVENKCQIGN
jgi:hypothetical protein